MAKRARVGRRALQRELGKLVRERDKLARLQPGGAPERPIELASSAQVEVHARTMKCPLCEGAFRVEEHTAEEHAGNRLRVARVVCVQCGVKRSIFFRLRALN